MTEVVLTPREEQVIRELLAGKNGPQIARHMGLSEQTVKNHVMDATRRNGMNRIQLAVAVATSPVQRPIRAQRIQHGRFSPEPGARPGTGCDRCDVGSPVDDGYHEVRDPDALGGTRWVRCSAAA